MDDTHQPAPAAARTADRPVVLVIDDDAAICDFLSRVFDDAGVSCHRVGSIEETRGMRLDHIRLVILDLSLGGGDAVDVLDHLADEDYGGGVMLITGFDIDALEPVHRLGTMIGLTMLPYLTKPLRPSQLKHAVAVACGTSQPDLSPNV